MAGSQINTSAIVVSSRDELINDVKKWILIEKQLKIITEKTRELRQIKNGCTVNICNYLSENPKYKNSIGVTGGELRVYQKKEYSALTFSFLEKCLGELIHDASQVDYIINYIKEKREIIVTDDLRIKES
jgi:hypothetical protein